MDEAPRTPFEALGEDGIAALVDRFYDAMDTRPDAARIRGMHGKDLTPIRAKLTTFFVGWMGGPSRYTERYGPVNIPSAHAPYAITAADRDAWMACFDEALAGAELPEGLRAAVRSRVAQMAEMCRTREDDGSVRASFAGLR